jgi:glycosyltransferase involved in cell wall biosynthesis
MTEFTLAPKESEEKSLIFDSEWYFNKYPDVAISGIPPIDHFEKFGKKLNRSPNKNHSNKSVITDIKNSVNHLILDIENKEIKLLGKNKKIQQKIHESIVNKKSPLLIFIGHDASITGAPLILIRLLKTIREISSFNILTILDSDGQMSSNYEKICPTLIKEFENEEYTHSDFFDDLEEILKSKKITPIFICNTVVTSKWSILAQERGIKSISLIHELPCDIDNYFGGSATIKNILNSSDKLIFPTEYSKKKSLNRYDIPEKMLDICPYGIKFTKKISEKKSIKDEIRKKLLILDNDKLYLSCGTYEHRKGFDLFIQVAKKTISNFIDRGLDVPFFAWVGPGLSSDYSQKIITDELFGYDYRNQFLFLNSVPNADEYIAASDGFMLCSRQESCGMVALEAAGYNVPVYLFEGCTGAEECLPVNSFLGASAFDIDQFSDLITNKNKFDEHGDYIRNNFSLESYAEKILLNVNTILEKIEPKVEILLIGYGPPPIGNRPSEGGGLRMWGLACAFKKLIPHACVKLAFKVSVGEPLPEGCYDGINVVHWKNENIESHIISATTLIFSFCMGSDSTEILDMASPSQLKILDCYVPIFTEVSARDSKNIEIECEGYIRDINYWNKTLQGGDLFMCANNNQIIYYQGILSSLGRMNPKTYRTDPTRLVPYGISSDLPKINNKPFSDHIKNHNKSSFKILWFGGVYPWFDISNLIHAINNIKSKVSVHMAMVGVKNPFVNHPDFNLKVVELENLIVDLGLEKNISLHDWISYEDRADWYCDCDIILTINKQGFENSLAWRTRLVDYVWSGMPVATNGGDPLGEDLINSGAAFRLNIDSALDLSDSILELINNPKKIFDMKSNMEDFRKNLYWENVCSDISIDIEKKSRI